MWQFLRCFNTSQHVGNMGMIEVNGNEIADVASLFPVVLYYGIDLHLSTNIITK